MACECESGKFGCACCCASVTGLRAGIHPDFIRTVTVDLALTEATPTRTQISLPLITGPIHIVSVSVGMASIKRNVNILNAAKQIELPGSTGYATVYGATPVMFSIYTAGKFVTGDLNDGGFANPATGVDRFYVTTGAVSSQAPSWQSPPDLFGYFCDGATFVEMNAPNDQFGLRVTLTYVDRLEFSPAYPEPVQTLQHYWSCAREEEFLSGMYGGTSFDVDSSATVSEGGGGRVSTGTEPSPTGWILD